MSQVIALVDDDRNILTSVSIALQQEGFIVRVYADPQQALRAISDNPPDLGVFDIKMPGMDGMELLRRVRESSAVPVIFLTSKDDELDEALGLSMGADDYISKPFSQRLLIARIRALLRRQQLARGEAETGDGEPEPPLLERGRLVMDPARHKVRWDDKDVSLTVTEFLILEALAQRPGVVKSRNQSLDVAYSDEGHAHDRFRLYGSDGRLLIDSWSKTGPTYELQDPSTQKWTKDVARALDRGFNFLVGARSLDDYADPTVDRLQAWPEAVRAVQKRRPT